MMIISIERAVSYSQVIIIDTLPRHIKRQFNLTGLEYANTVYDVRVFLRSVKAVGENMYSDFSVITFRTLSTCKWIYKIVIYYLHFIFVLFILV